jgi:hypothetical protein
MANVIKESFSLKVSGTKLAKVDANYVAAIHMNLKLYWNKRVLPEK